jgi:hypothetical protein
MNTAEDLNSKFLQYQTLIYFDTVKICGGYKRAGISEGGKKIIKTFFPHMGSYEFRDNKSSFIVVTNTKRWCLKNIKFNSDLLEGS